MASETIKIYAPASSQYYYELRVDSFENEQTEKDKLDNSSVVTVVGTLRSYGIGFGDSTKHSLSIYWHDDNEYQQGKLLNEIEITSLDVGKSSQVIYNIRVKHNVDGTLKGWGTAKFTKKNNNKFVPNTSEVYSGWVNLATIPRATIISNKTLTIGQKSTISWTKASDNFRHKLEYKFGNYSGVIGTELVDSVEWTPSNELYSVIPNSPSDKGTLTLTTYNGKTITGTSSATLTLNASEDSVKAQITNADVIDNNDKTTSLTGDANKLILNVSNSYISFDVTTRQYAKIKEIYINDGSYSLPKGVVSGSNTNYHFEANLGISTTGTYDIIVVDTRDFKTTYRVSQTTIDYIALDSNVKIKRIAPTTGEVGITFDGNYFNRGFGKVNNYLKISYAYRVKNVGNYSAFKPITQFKIVGDTFHSGTANYKQTIKLAESFDYQNTYDIQIKFEDAITTKITNAIIVKGIPIFWWNLKKFVVDGDLFVADENGNNAVNVLDKIPEIKTKYDNSDVATYSTNYINSLDTKNYDEQETAIGKWIDGKTIYRKVIVTNSVSEEINYVSTGIINMDWCVKAEGMAFMQEANIFLPLNFYNVFNGVEGWNAFHLNDGGEKITIQRGTNYVINKAIFILEYTKK